MKREDRSLKNEVNRDNSSLKYKRKRRKKRGFNIVFLFAILICCLSLGVVIGSFLINRKKEKLAYESSLAMNETILKQAVKVDDIDITGFSKKKAHDEILKNYAWDMKVNYNEEVYHLNNIIEEQLNNILDEIFTGAKKDQYYIEFTNLDELIDKEIDEIANKWEIEPKNASLVSFDKASGEYIYEDGADGKEVDRAYLKETIAKAIEEKNFKKEIELKTKLTKPRIATKEEVKSLYTVIGTFTTTTTDNKDRNTNIDLANQTLDGLVIKPKEEFSFNLTTGNRTIERGYKPAGAYLNGKLIEEPGGGVCQVSSTLYNAVIFSGLKTTERHQHSFEPSYVTPGEDAMVSYDGFQGPDMKFVNTSDFSIVLRAKLIDKKLTVSVIGIPILGEDEKVYMSSKRIAEYDEPKPEFENDATLSRGEDVLVKPGKKGSRWITNIVHKKGNSVLKDEVLHYSTYKGKTATIRRNIDLSGTEIDQATLNEIEESALNQMNENQATQESTEIAETQKKQENTTPQETKKTPSETKRTPGSETETEREVITRGPGAEENTDASSSASKLQEAEEEIISPFN